MAVKASYTNNFTISMQNLTVILDARTNAPNIENTNYGAPVFDERKTVDENYLFMPVEVAKELALSILHIVGTSEARSGLKIRLKPEKQAEWEAAVRAANDARESQKAHEDEAEE